MTKLKSRGLLAACAAGAVLVSQVGVARADPDPVSDSWQATCQVLSKDLTGNPATDLSVLAGIGAGIARYYGVTVDQAVAIELAQVSYYCPRWMPYVRAATHSGAPGAPSSGGVAA